MALRERAQSKPTEPQSTVPTSAPTPPPEAPADPWASLEEPSYAAAPKGVYVDVEKIPVQIRDFIERSLGDYDESVTVNGKTIPAGEPKYQHKRFRNAELAASFVKLVHRYATYRPPALGGPITVQAVVVKNDPTLVRVAAKPRVTKTRTPEVAAAAKAKAKATREANKAAKAAEKK